MNQSRGFFLIVVSAFFYGTYGVWSRIMGSSFGEFSQAWTRGLFLLLFVLLVNFIFKIFKPIQKQDIPWLVAIGLAGGINQAPYYFGFQHLTIGTATLLFYAALVVGGYTLGRVFFNEKMSLVKIISLILSIFGTTYIYRLQLNQNQVLPATLTIIAGFLGSATVILPRKLIGNYPEFQIMVSYFSAQIIFNGILSLLTYDSPPPLFHTSAWLGQLGYALAMVLANWAAIEGYRHFEASLGSLIGLTEIIFGVVLGIALFHEPISSSTITGSIIIIFAAALPHFSSLALKPLHHLPNFTRH